MIQKEAKAMLRALGFSLTKRGGEYRVAPRAVTRQRAEDMAYYTDDIQDAIGTALQEFRSRLDIVQMRRHSIRSIEFSMTSIDDAPDNYDKHFLNYLNVNSIDDIYFPLTML